MKRIVAVFIFIVVLAISIAFSIFNYASVTVDYLAGEIDLPLSVLIIVILIIGILLGLLADAYLILKYRSQLKALRKQAETSASELKNLRNLPIKDLS